MLSVKATPLPYLRTLSYICSKKKQQPKLCLKNSEYDQEIPQSQTADKPMTQRGRARHQEDKFSKATSSLFPIKMIAKLEWTYSKRTSKQRTITDSHNGGNNKQKVNNN